MSRKKSVSFTGTFESSFVRNLDAKRRLVVPAEFRNDGINFTIYPRPHSQSLIAHFVDISPFRDLTSQDKALMATFKNAVHVDTAGRITLTERMQEHLNIHTGDELRFVGRGLWYEIWNEQTWKSQQLQSEEAQLTSLLHDKLIVG